MLFATSYVYSANRYSRNSGNWNSTSTWSATSNGKAGASVPIAGDTVFIEIGRTVTIDSAFAAYCAILNIGSKNPGSAELIFSSNSSLTVSANVQIGGRGGPTSDFADGSIVFAQGSKMTVKGLINIGAADLMSSGSLDFTKGGLLQIGNVITVYLKGSFKPGTGTIEYNGAAQTVAPTNLLGVYNNLTLSGTGIKTITAATVKGILSMEGSATVSNSITTTSSATLQYKGTAAQITGPEFGVLSGNPATRTFGGSGGVVINNPNGVKLGCNTAISNILKLTSGDFNIDSNLLTLYGKPILCKGGNLKTSLASSLAFISNDTGLYIPDHVVNLDFLSIISTTGILLKGDLSCNTLSLIGKITTASHVLTVDAFTGAPGTSNYINGNLQHLFSPEAVSFLFPVGDAKNYTPVYINFDKISTAGSLILNTTAKKYSKITSSGLKIPTILHRYWSIVNNGIVFKSYASEFSFATEDVPVGAKVNAYILRNFTTSWNSSTTVARNAIFIRAFQQHSFGDFVIGESVCNAAISILTPDSSSLIANGSDIAVLTVYVKDSNANIAVGGGAIVKITKLEGEGIIGEVSDKGDGSYTAIVTAPSTLGNGVFVATLDGVAIKNGGKKQSRSYIHYIAGPPNGKKSSLNHSGQAINDGKTFKQLLTITARDENANPIAKGGAKIKLNRISGSGSISETTDAGNGMYTVWITAPVASGSGEFSAEINGEAVQNDTENPSSIKLTY
ncbi:MAG: Ig-like domain-containing protein [Bacteroidales bacterium]